VLRLCEALNAVGAPAEVATVASPGDQAEAPTGTPLHTFPLAPPAPLRRSPALAAFLDDQAARFDVVHVHGLWQWPGVYARRAALRHGRPLVISPRGMLEPWALGQRGWLKRLALATWEGRNLRAARLLHATSEAEARRFIALGLSSQGIVVPNGVSAPEPGEEGKRRDILVLGRYHPVKGGDLLIEAWGSLWREFPAWTLRFAGPDDGGTRARWQSLADGLGIGPASISFEGPALGTMKWAKLRTARLVALPSHSENFGNVVLEALSQGTPVLASQHTPWASLPVEGCGWWVPNEPPVLERELRRILAQSEEDWRRMQGLAVLYASTFTWPAVAARFVEAYQGLLGSPAPTPDKILPKGTP
jgi:glycosyltransferase involved in cell wall biosynthesis